MYWYNINMKNTRDVKIVAFIGMPGAGKSSAVDYVIERKYPRVYFGDVLQAVRDAGLEETPDNERYMREKLRKEDGNDFIAKRAAKQINDLIEAGQKRIIVESLYSWTEYKFLKNAFPGELFLVAIVAPRSLRHKRLSKRPIRPLTPREAMGRDWSEIENLEKGGPIAIADHYIQNTGDIEELHEKVDIELKDIGF